MPLAQQVRPVRLARWDQLVLVRRETFAYIYNIGEVEEIPVEGAVPFSNNGLIVGELSIRREVRRLSLRKLASMRSPLWYRRIG